MTARSIVFDHVATLSDTTRCRILRLLERQELMVTELCTVLQLPQSTVSRHLRLLVDGGWLQSRREGTSNFYAMDLERLEQPGPPLWRLIRDEMVKLPQSEQDAQRLDAVVAERRSRSQEFFTSAADDWDRMRDQLFGEHFDLTALSGLLDPMWVIGDLACGTGRVAAALAPCVSRVIAVDSSAAMLRAARGRLGRLDSVEVREGTLENLPIAEATLDAATLFLALHHVPDPGRVLREANRVLRPGGRLLVVDMAPHDRADYQQQMGHVWLGFAAEQMTQKLTSAGLERPAYRLLPADPAAKGPTLFAATANAPQQATTRREPDRPTKSKPSRQQVLPQESKNGKA